MSDTAVSTSDVDRSLPEKLIELAVEAIKHGYVSVWLGQGGDGADNAPAEWILHMIKELQLVGQPAHPDSKIVCFAIGDSLDRLLEGFAFHDEDAGQRVDEVLLELFTTCLRNGWQAGYERDVIEHEVNTKMRIGYPDLPMLGMRHKLTATAINWAYDETSRARDESPSMELSLSRRVGGDGRPDQLAFAINFDHTFGPTTAAAVEAQLSQQAPCFVRMAYYNQTTEEMEY